MNAIDRCFAKILNKPCWGVESRDTWISFKFGNPHLQIVEPRPARDKMPSIVRKIFVERHDVIVRGEWQLMIAACDWVVRSHGREFANSKNPRGPAKAARFLWGQRLISVVLSKRGARTLFQFDLGGELETRPFSRKDLQWQLREPGDYFLEFRGDRKYAYAHGSNRKNGKPRRQRWHRV